MGRARQSTSKLYLQILITLLVVPVVGRESWGILNCVIIGTLDVNSANLTIHDRCWRVARSPIFTDQTKSSLREEFRFIEVVAEIRRRV